MNTSPEFEARLALQRASFRGSKRLISGEATLARTLRGYADVRPAIDLDTRCPVPLLWRSWASPIGWIREARVLETSVTFEARIANSGLEHADEAWARIKAGRVGIVEIHDYLYGSNYRTGPFGLERQIEKWLWLALCVGEENESGSDVRITRVEAVEPKAAKRSLAAVVRDYVTQ